MSLKPKSKLELATTSVRQCLWLNPRRSVLHLRSEWRVIGLLVPLWVLLSVAQAQVTCTGEQERASAITQRINQEWPMRSNNDLVSTYVQRLGQQLAQTLVEGRSLVWHFSVVRDRSSNAFSIGNGYIYVTDGAVVIAQNESEVAAVLAHEIGHQLAGHFCESVSFFDWLFSREEKYTIGSLTQVIDISKEKQADQYAVTILKAAGYDPRSMLVVAKRLQSRRRVEALEGLLIDTKSSKPSKNSAEFQQVKRKLATE